MATASPTAPRERPTDRRSAQAIDMSSFIPALLTNLAQKITTAASAAYRPLFGVGITDWRIIALLASEPWLPPVKICDATGLDKAAVSRSLRDLAEAGLIETMGDGVAQRRLPVVLTGRGLAIHDEIVVHARERERTLLKGFTAAEREQLRDFIARMQRELGPLEQED